MVARVLVVTGQARGLPLRNHFSMRLLPEKLYPQPTYNFPSH